MPDEVGRDGGTVATAVRAVLFDAGNTLVYLDRRRMAELFARVGVETEPEAVREAELKARTRLHEGIEDGHSGTEPALWQSYFEAFFAGSGVPYDRMADAGGLLRDTHATDHMWTGMEEGTFEALDRLRSMGLRLAVISNADGRMEDVLRRVGVRDRLEFVVDSDAVGMEKPDAAIFHHAADRLGLQPAECLYVGDLFPVDYVGATAAGMRAVLLDPLGLHEERAETVPSLEHLPDFVAAL